MLTQITAIVPVGTAHIIPTSPAQISPETSLDELNAIKSAWTQAAREMNYPAKACHVAFWLGREIITHPREHVYKVWSGGNVYLLVREYEEAYRAADGTCMKVCILLGFIGEPDLTHKNPVDQILLDAMVPTAANDPAVGRVVDLVAKNVQTATSHHRRGRARIVHANVVDVVPCDQGIRSVDLDAAGPGLMDVAIDDATIGQLSHRDAQTAYIADYQAF